MDQSGLVLVVDLDVKHGICVGTASVNWGFDPLYTWVHTPSFSQMLDEMAASGYAGTEISYHFPDDARVLSDALAQRGLRAASSFFAVDLRDPAKHAAATKKALQIAERLQSLGADVLILSDLPSAERLEIAGRVAHDGSDALPQSGFRAMADGLNHIGRALKSRGMRAVFHPHVGTFVETRAEIDTLYSLLDGALVGLCPDTGHLAYAGVPIADVFEDYAACIGHVHLKDVDAEKLERVRSERIDFAGAVRLGLFVELGKGIVSIPALVRALRGAKYAGWLIVEQDAPEDPLGSAKRNRAYMRDAMGL
jgi:inosose dehydratase